MESEENSRITEALTRRAGRDPTAAQIASATVATLQNLDAALTPVIGQRGVAALYRRSLHLCATSCEDLSGVHESVQSSMDLAAFERLLAQHSSAYAFSVGVTLLTTFNELLATLVGPSLTERLLRSVWEKSFSGTPAQDISP